MTDKLYSAADLANMLGTTTTQLLTWRQRWEQSIPEPTYSAQNGKSQLWNVEDATKALTAIRRNTGRDFEVVLQSKLSTREKLLQRAQAQEPGHTPEILANPQYRQHHS